MLNSIVTLRTTRRCSAIVGVLLSCTALADKPNTVEITPFGGYRYGGEFESAVIGSEAREDLKIKAGSSYGVTLNLIQEADAYYELTYSKQSATLEATDPTIATSFGLSDGLELSIEYLHIGGHIEFPNPQARVIPYFVLTVGLTRLKPTEIDSDDDVEPSIALGGGVKIRLARHIALRLEARGYMTFLDTNSRVFCKTSAQTTGVCGIQEKGDMFVQAQGLFGVTVGF
ncbi:MAG: hypothetical protein H7Y02_11750 [Candidatus Obscuribacterales bacterium]|nr:hypothetical protein [Steroidobacteraceae bacterium]